METISLRARKYAVDSAGFIFKDKRWDENFAQGMAPMVGIDRLSARHWKVINYVRDTFEGTGRCPTVYETCRANYLTLKELKRLFPTGYMRGACKLAGVTYRAGYPNIAIEREITVHPEKGVKIYELDQHGFLIDPTQWDEIFAFKIAHQVKRVGDLIDRHWEVIYFLREAYMNSGVVPTVYDTCEALLMELDDLERLFPEGYQRGAVRMAGLRAM